MTALPESSSFDAEVTQIETTEPVVGGVAGVANRALIQLGNRTKYLYDQIAAILADLTANYALKNGTYSTLRAQATTKADVGLGLVANYDNTDLATGGETNKYATGAAAKQAWDKAVEALNAANAVDVGAGIVKAWVNMTCVGTVAINASANVASITDDGVGQYTITFTTPFAGSAYVALGNAYKASPVTIDSLIVTITARSTTSVSVRVETNENDPYDPDELMLAIVEAA